jgi:hypothetical protein
LDPVLVFLFHGTFFTFGTLNMKLTIKTQRVAKRKKAVSQTNNMMGVKVCFFVVVNVLFGALEGMKKRHSANWETGQLSHTPFWEAFERLTPFVAFVIRGTRACMVKELVSALLEQWASWANSGL